MEMSRERLAVIIDMTFNMNDYQVRWPKLTQAIVQSDWEWASREMLDSLYARQVPMRALRNSEIMRTG